MKKLNHLALAMSLLAAALLDPAASFAGDVWGTVELPVHSLKGGRLPLRVTFEDSSGAPLAEEILFDMTVTGKTRFAREVRKGTLHQGGGKISITAETDGGVFEIDIETTVAESARIGYFQSQSLPVSGLRRIAFADPVDGKRRPWHTRTLGGSPALFTIVEAPGEVAGDGPAGRDGVLTWWSGAVAPSSDTAFVSIPLRVPARAATSLRFLQRRGLEPLACLNGKLAHHGARLEVENAAGSWIAVEPAGGYPHAGGSTCPHGLQGQPVWGGTTGGIFEESRFDLGFLAGQRARLRLRLATGCEQCGPMEGIFIDDVRVETSDLGFKVFEPGSDTDGDGLAVEEEIVRGTDPDSEDTDGDGLIDSVEDASGVYESPAKTGTDPLSPDSDGAGVVDAAEAFLGTNPNDPRDEPRRLSFDLELPAGNRNRWIVKSDGSIGKGAQDPLEEVFEGRGGFRLVIDGVPFPPQGEAYSKEAGDAYFVGPDRVGPFRITRRIFSLADSGAIAFLETFENVSGKDENRRVTLESEFAQKKWIEVESTASGAVAWTAAEDAVHFNDRDPGDGMPSLLWRYKGPGARVGPLDVALSEGVARISFAIALGPDEKESVLHFAALSPGLAEGKKVFQALRDLDPALLSGFSFEDESRVINMGFDRDRDGMPTFFETENGLDPRNGSDASEDADGDGLSNLDEYRAGTNLRSADTDGDGLADGKEVREAGTNPLAADTDGDGIGDAEDSAPLKSFIAEFHEERIALAGGKAAVEVRIREGISLGALPVRFTLSIEGQGAFFAGPVDVGQVIEGLQTSVVVVETREGRVRLNVECPTPQRLSVVLIDSERAGVLAPSSIFEDFERGDGHFVAEGLAGAWKWGEPPAHPGSVSGRKVWGTGLSGRYPPEARDTLTTPEFRLDPEGTPRLELRHFLEVEEDFDFARVEVTTGGEFMPLVGAEFLPNTADRYQPLSFSLGGHRGRGVRFRFTFDSDYEGERLGWFLDDFRVEGLQTKALVVFLAPEEDPDRDGLTSRQEFERGSDPNLADTDGDGLGDAVETATGVFVDAKDTGTRPAVPDTDGGGEIDGAEVAARKNPFDPLDDLVRLDDDALFRGVVMPDGAGNVWQVDPQGIANSEGPDAFLELGRLSVETGFFFPDEATLSYDRQIITLKSPAGFGDPISVTRKLFVTRDGPYLRWLEVFQDSLGSTQSLEFELSFLAFGISPGEVARTSDGDLEIDADDEYFIFKVPRENGALYVGQRLRNSPATIRPSRVESSLAHVAIGHSLQVPARGSAAFLHFMAVSPKVEDVEAAMEALKRPDAVALAGLTEGEMDQVANFFIDSDGDGIPDGFERRNGLNSKDPSDAEQDADADGLINRAEYELGTNPRSADTDVDGLTDRQEVEEKHTNPTRFDTDGDGVEDGKDAFPLARISVRRPNRAVALAGQETRWSFRLDVEGPPEALPPGWTPAGLRVSLRFSRPMDEVKAVSGAPIAAQDPRTYLFDLDGEWTAVDVRSTVAGPVTIEVQEADGKEIKGAAAVLRFLEATADEDGDGLSNVFEIDRGTDPLAKDSDGDGLLDGIESSSGIVSPRLDTGTFPWAVDSDGGGVFDGVEVLSGKDPLFGGDDIRRVSLPVSMPGGQPPAGSVRWEVFPSWAVASGTAGAGDVENGGAIRVHGKSPPSVGSALAGEDGASIVIGPVSHDGLEISRSVCAHPTLPLLRFVDRLVNPSDRAVPASIDLAWDFALPLGVVGTSSGDGVLDPRDRWIVFSHGRGAILRASFAAAPVGETELVETDLLQERIRFDIPPGGRKTLVHFLAHGPASAPLIELAARLSSWDREVFQGLAAEDAADSANLLPLSPVVWSIFPRSAAAPGDLLTLEGEFLQPGLEVRLAGALHEPLRVLSGHILLRAPPSVGEYPVEVRLPGGKPIHFPGMVRVEAPVGRFLRGDFNADGLLDIADAIAILEHLFRGAPPPLCRDAADTDDNGKVELTDSIHLLQVLFQGEGEIPLPGGVVPGIDPTPDGLECAQ